MLDDATNSAAVELLAALLSHREDVRVLGTETQGACGRHTGQVPVLFRHAGLSVFVSLFEIDLVPIAGCQRGRGIVPDIEVVYAEEHFLAAIRTSMRSAIGHIASRKQGTSDGGDDDDRARLGATVAFSLPVGRATKANYRACSMTASVAVVASAGPSGRSARHTAWSQAS